MGRPGLTVQGFLRRGWVLLDPCPQTEVKQRVGDLFGSDLVGMWPPFTLQPHLQPGRALRPMRARRIMWEATEDELVGPEQVTATPATDLVSEGVGLIGGGPDLLALAPVRSGLGGGEYRLVDGSAVFDSLPPAIQTELTTSPLALRLRSTVPPTVRPLLERTAAGRLVVTYAPGAIVSELAFERPRLGRTLAAAETWHREVQAALTRAEPITVEVGQTLLVDAHRMLYQRARYLGDRRVDRYWAWTVHALGFPMVTTGEKDDPDFDPTF